jgi:hypothetical protein
VGKFVRGEGSIERDIEAELHFHGALAGVDGVFA